MSLFKQYLEATSSKKKTNAKNIKWKEAKDYLIDLIEDWNDDDRSDFLEMIKFKKYEDASNFIKSELTNQEWKNLLNLKPEDEIIQNLVKQI